MLNDLNAKTLNELHNVVKYIVLLNTDKKNACSISYIEGSISIQVLCHWRKYHSMVVRDGWVYSNSWTVRVSTKKDIQSCYGKLKKIGEELAKLLYPENWKELVLKSALESKGDLDYASNSVLTKLDLENVKKELLNEHELNLDYSIMEKLTLDRTLELVPNERDGSLYWRIQQPNELYPYAVDYRHLVKKESGYHTATTHYTSQYPNIEDWLNDKQ